MTTKLHRQHQAGIGLIELLVSMFIGLFIMAGVLQMFSTTSQNQIATAGASRIQENIRYAFSRIATDVAQAGNLGCFNASALDQYVLDGADIEPIQNYLGVNSSPVAANSAYDFLSLIGGGSTALSDVLRVRYVSHRFKIPVTSFNTTNTFTVDHTDSDFASLKAGQIVSVSNCSNGVIFVLTSDPDSAGNISVAATAGSGLYNTKNDLELLDSSQTQYYLYGGRTGAYEYSIGTSTGASDCANADNECSLFRSTGPSTTEEVLRGVHDLQIRYGTTDATGALVYQDHASVTDWNAVDRLKITLSFNSINDAQSSGNNIQGLLSKTVTRTFNLHNQL